MRQRSDYSWVGVPESKKVTGKICFISTELTLTGEDLDSCLHKGFTIGRGKKMYWMMIWHNSGNVTVFDCDTDGPTIPRWIKGDTEITVHFI